MIIPPNVFQSLPSNLLCLPTQRFERISLFEKEEELSIITKKIGSAPILKYFIERMGIVSIIDKLVQTHPNREIITHGEAVAGLVAYLLHGGRALYRVEQWAEDTEIASEIFPQYLASDWTDDRLDDTLDALYLFGLESIQGAISTHLCSEFSISLDKIHYDTTSVSLYGVYENQDPQGVVITYGHSKDRRPDLRQVVVGMAVSGDGGVPLISNTHNGNTSDSVIPVSYWERLSKVALKKDFVFIGDCKLASKGNMIDIASSGGKFLSLYPMNKSEQEQLVLKQLEGEIVFRPVEVQKEERKPTYEKRTTDTGNRSKQGDDLAETDKYYSYEESMILKDDSGHTCVIRKIYMLSEKLRRQHSSLRERHLEEASKELEDLKGRLNKRNLTTQEAIKSSVESILKRKKVGKFILYSISEKIEVIKKKKGRGRPGPNSEYIYEKKKVYTLEYSLNEEELEKASLRDGIFILVSNANDSEWPVERLLALYKCQWKVEGNIHVFKGPFAASPMFLEKPKRICAMMFIITLALQLYTLIKREVAKALLNRNRPLKGLMPNRIRTWRPQTNELLAAFDNIQLIKHVRGGEIEVYVTTLNSLQKEILRLLAILGDVYSVESIVHRRKYVKLDFPMTPP
jgi:transposase